MHNKMGEKSQVYPKTYWILFKSRKRRFVT